MAKHLVDIDEAALLSARAQLRTSTLRDTVNEALRLAGLQRSDHVKGALDRLETLRFVSREDAWR